MKDISWITVVEAVKTYGIIRRTAYNRAKAGAPHRTCECGTLLVPDDEDMIQKFYK